MRVTHADTVVVGAGSAGAIIAARMTENSAHDVMLLEAGPDYPEAGRLPADLVDGTKNSVLAHDWGYRHRPNPHHGLLRFPRGRVVGGSSAVNTCIALRGQPHDYDEWAARGLPEWSFDKCLPAFKRLEDDRDFGGPWHGQGGPIPVRRHPVSECGPWQAAFLGACGELGFASCPDTNDPRLTGFGPHTMNKIDGVRMSAARGYLTRDVRERSNLRILPETIVHRVLIRSRRVVGLTVETRGRVHDIRTSRVILAAGAVSSPGILLRSGVGPRASVERIGVDLVADIPAIGARLLDHPGAGLLFWPGRGQRNHEFPLIQNVLRFTSKGSPCSNDMQLQPGSFFPIPIPGSPRAPVVMLMCCVGKPRGHGVIRFVDANARTRPIIESRLLVDAADRAMAAEGLRLALRCADSSAMKSLVTLVWPSRAIVQDPSKLESFLFRISDSGYHPCGTVPMGADGDPRGAVTQRGRVREVEGLWVADASVMPTIPSSNTNFPTMMMGERFGEWFREGAP